jgi:hypothetical protein
MDDRNRRIGKSYQRALESPTGRGERICRAGNSSISRFSSKRPRIGLCLVCRTGLAAFVRIGYGTGTIPLVCEKSYT